MTNEDELAQLKRELKAELKAELEAKPRDYEREAAEWRDQMHRLSEGRMSQASPPPSADDRRNMNAACPDNQMKGIALRDARAPTGPSSAGAIPSSQTVSNVRGWAREIPLRPPEGVNYADRLMDEQDRRDRAELAQRLGALKR
jgi:hypothetical protein